MSEKRHLQLLSDDDLITQESKRDRWDEQSPALPEHEYRRAMTIVTELTDRYQGAQPKNTMAFWKEINERAAVAFEKMGIHAHVMFAITAKHAITGTMVEVPEGDWLLDDDGDIIVKAIYGDPIMITPLIKIDDYINKDIKKNKEEERIIESEARRAAGGAYHIRSVKDLPKK